VRINDHRPSVDVTHTTLSVLFIALLAAATFWVLRPFLTSVLWATVVSVAAWPLLLRLEAVLGRRRGLAVAIMTTTILLIVFVPITLALVTIIRNVDNIGNEIRSIQTVTLPGPPRVLDRFPIAGAPLAAKWRQFAALGPDDRAAIVIPYAQTALRWFLGKAGSVGGMLLQFVLTAIVAAVLFAKGEVVREGVLSFATRLAGREGHDVAIHAAATIRSVVLGVAGTALIQTAIGGFALFLTGVPGAALLTAVMLFLCLAQLGPALVLAPAVAWMYWSGSAGWGTTLLVLSLIAATIDNFIRPILIKRGANIPLILIFAGVIGGLLAFGIVGLFIGPVVLTVTHTLLSHWVAAEAPSEMAR